MEIAGFDDSSASIAALGELDAAFAHAIYDATVRRWLTLRFLLAPLTHQPIEEMEARVQAALLASAAQLALLDRVPTHAVINHAVEWCKQRIRPGAGAVANAVLRKFVSLIFHGGEKVRRDTWSNRRDEIPQSDGGALVLSGDLLPEGELERAAVATSHPAELLGSWAKRAGEAEAVRLAHHGLASPPTVVNIQFASADAELRGVLEDPLRVARHESGSHVVWRGGRPDLRALLRARDDIWVQDAAASEAVCSVLDLSPVPGLIIDVCAGQGTKTRQLVRAFPSAQIVATDSDPVRVETLSRVFAGSARVRVMDLKSLAKEYSERADLVLLDVPCSNTGVLARRPEAKYRYSVESIRSLMGVQRQIIADAIPLVSRGANGGRRGRLLYSTCSLEREENEGMSEWACEWHQFKGARETRRSPGGGPGQADTAYHDGAYSTLLE